MNLCEEVNLLDCFGRKALAMTWYFRLACWHFNDVYILTCSLRYRHCEPQGKQSRERTQCNDTIRRDNFTGLLRAKSSRNDVILQACLLTFQWCVYSEKRIGRVSTCGVCRKFCVRDPRIGKSLSGQEQRKAQNGAKCNVAKWGLAVYSPTPRGICRFGGTPTSLKPNPKYKLRKVQFFYLRIQRIV